MTVKLASGPWYILKGVFRPVLLGARTQTLEMHFQETARAVWFWQGVYGTMWLCRICKVYLILKRKLREKCDMGRRIHFSSMFTDFFL